MVMDIAFAVHLYVAEKWNDYLVTLNGGKEKINSISHNLIV